MAGKPWQLCIISLIFLCVFAQIISVFCTSKGKRKVLQTSTEPKLTWNKDKHCECSLSSYPKSHSFLDFWHSTAVMIPGFTHTSQAGDKMLVRLELSKSSPMAKGWEISPVFFILSCVAVLRYLTDARVQFLSFGTCFAVEQVRKIIWCPQGNPSRAGLYWWLLSQRIHLKDYDPLSEAVQCSELQISWRKKRLPLSPKQKNPTRRQILLSVI